MSCLSFNEYRDLWDLVSRKPFLTGFPLHLDIELTSRCNLRCAMCFQRHIEAKRADMPDTVFKKIIDEGVEEGLCAIKLQSRGESLLHPGVFDLLTYAKQRGILDVHITTNALLLNEDKIKNLVDSGLDLLIISYDKFHCDASALDEQEYTAFIKDVVSKAKLYTRKSPHSSMKVRIQTCIRNYTEKIIAAEEAKNRQLFPEADAVLINPLYESYEDDAHLENLDEYTFYPCSYLWQRLTIYSDGAVTTCSRDYNCKYNRIGSVKVSSIRELWHSAAMREMRKLHLTGEREKFHICAVCENYLIHNKTGLPGAGCTGTVYPFKGEEPS